MTDRWLLQAEVSLIVGALVVLGLWRLIGALDGRGHTGSIRLPLAAGLLVRLAAVAIAAAVPAIGHKLTSTDEATFLATTKTLAMLPLSSAKWLSMGLHWTEVIPWALTYKLFGECGTLPLRLEQIGLSLCAVVLISATAGKIGGRRAALAAAWVAALEPSSAYFGGLLHQESLCMVGEALLLGALVDAWIRDNGRWRPLVCALAGLALIFGTRSYLAFFAAVAGALVLAAAALQRRLGLARGLLTLTALASLAALVGVFAAPHVVPGGLANLQHQLDLPYVGANLPLPHATVTNGSGLLKTVVLRSFDLLLRPYPWQTGSAAQKVAVAGTLIWYVLVLVTLWLTLSQGLDGRLVPALVLIVCEAIGFALTLVDAGEGFRHRVNLLLILAVPLGVMLARRWPAGAADPWWSTGRLDRRWSAARPRMEYAHRAARPSERYPHMYIYAYRYGRGRVRGRGQAYGRGQARHRVVVAGALTGLVVALGLALAMPSRELRTVPIPARAGQRVAVYGALAPYAPRTLSEPSVQHSPRTLRDALLGLLAGGLAAGALLTVARPVPVRRS